MSAGNRWPDVCALCDTAIDMTLNDYHRYIGPGMVHGGGREYIPVHHTCIYTGSLYQRGLLTEGRWPVDLPTFGDVA